MLVLHVEDDPIQQRFVSKVLSSQRHSVVTFASALPALDYARKTEPDVLLVDYQLGDGPDGLRLAEQIRHFYPGCVIVMISGVAGLPEAIRAMQSGVDDFFIKPVKAETLVSDLWGAVLRRRAWLPLPAGRSETNALLIDKKRRTATWHGQPLPLTPIQFALLEHLSSRPNATIGFSELYTYCKGKMGPSDTAREMLKQHIIRLRKKLEQNGKYPRAVVNVWGQGFKWVEAPAVSDAAD